MHRVRYTNSAAYDRVNVFLVSVILAARIYYRPDYWIFTVRMIAGFFVVVSWMVAISAVKAVVMSRAVVVRSFHACGFLPSLRG